MTSVLACGCSDAAADPAPTGAAVGLAALVLTGLVVAAAVALRQRRAEARAIRGLEHPADPWSQIDQVMVNQAVVTYVWGLPRQAVPGDHADDVRRWFGRTAGPLLSIVAGYLEAAFEMPDGDRERIADGLRGDHPELSRDAARSLAAWAVHTWSTVTPEPLPT